MIFIKAFIKSCISSLISDKVKRVLPPLNPTISYAKLLSVTITALLFAVLDYPDGS